MGKNTPERKDHMMENLVVPVGSDKSQLISKVCGGVQLCFALG